VVGSVGEIEADGQVQPPEPPRRRNPVRTAVRTIGELLITAGLVVLLFVAYEVYVTDWISAGKQRAATEELDREWRAPGTTAAAERNAHFQGLKEGQGFAKMYVPAFGPDYRFTILEGTSESTLAIGPGHYKGTGYPGPTGNFAVAGHRVGKGAPFNDIDLLASCDAIVVETRDTWFVYRVLPKAGEVNGWAAGKGKQAGCAGVQPLGGEYTQVRGQEIVLPSEGSVVATVPHKDVVPKPNQQVGLMTLTTCNPKFSDRERLIVHAVLVHVISKADLAPGRLPDEMKES
jgi:sortase A